MHKARLRTIKGAVSVSDVLQGSKKTETREFLEGTKKAVSFNSGVDLPSKQVSIFYKKQTEKNNVGGQTWVPSEQLNISFPVSV